MLHWSSCLYSNAHSSVIHNSQKVETTEMSTDLNPDPQKAVLIHTWSITQATQGMKFWSRVLHGRTWKR